MKVEFKPSEKITLVAEGETQFDIFQTLAEMQEVFAEDACGKCKSKWLRFVVRNVQDGKKEYKYPELRCGNPSCRAKLTFGQSENGKLFPVRFKRQDGEYVKDENGRNIQKGNWGWVIYNKETGEEE